MAALTTATFPLQSWRMFDSWRWGDHLCFRLDAIDGNRARFRAAVKTDSTTGAVVPRVARRMVAVGVQRRLQFHALGRTGLDTQPAALTLLDIDRDFTSRLSRHASPRRRFVRSR